jgi:hypothetical protein
MNDRTDTIGLSPLPDDNGALLIVPGACKDAMRGWWITWEGQVARREAGLQTANAPRCPKQGVWPEVRENA